MKYFYCWVFFLVFEMVSLSHIVTFAKVITSNWNNAIFHLFSFSNEHILRRKWNTIPVSRHYLLWQIWVVHLFPSGAWLFFHFISCFSISFSICLNNIFCRIEYDVAIKTNILLPLIDMQHLTIIWSECHRNLKFETRSSKFNSN